MDIIIYIIDFIFLNLSSILSIIGTLLVAISFGRYPVKDAAPYTVNDKGQKKYIAYFNYPYLFYFGLLFMFFGFFVNLF